MGMTDPISDLLTRVRNAIAMSKDNVLVPASNMKLRIVYLLKEEGFIKNFKFINDDKQGMICIYLKYDDSNRKSAITQLQRISRPGRRTYVKSDNLPRVRNGLGIAIISTSQGVMTDFQAGKAGIGGEHVCSVW
ncbi:MAG: 30S ribosomal protein S8 [Myxococcales bacterium]|nr:30S ribosomal protein S8 [Myxococcales bacterium]